MVYRGAPAKSCQPVGRLRRAASPPHRSGRPVGFGREITAKVINSEVLNNWGRVVLFDLKARDRDRRGICRADGS